MSKGVFRSHNKVGDTLSFQTNIDSGSTFTPGVIMLNGNRPSWDLGVGGSYTANTSISYVYNGDTGETKTVTLRTNLLSNITAIGMGDNNIVGELDLRGLDNLFYYTGPGSAYFSMGDNPQLTAITHSYSPHKPYFYYVENSNLTGELDLTMFPKMGGLFKVNNNPNLTYIRFTGTSQVFGNNFNVTSNDLTGNLDLSMLSGFTNQVQFAGNPNLTGITYTSATNPYGFSSNITYYTFGPSITGTHDMSMVTFGNGVLFYCSGNANLTHLPHKKPLAGTGTFGAYHLANCNITGNHDLSGFPNFGGSFQMQSNPNLTGVTHTASTQSFDYYRLQYCNIRGNHDTSMLSGIGGSFRMDNNPNLTGMTQVGSAESFTTYWIHNCDLQGTFHIPYSGLSGSVYLYNNSGLTMVTHVAGTGLINAYDVRNCNLGGAGGTLDLSGLENLGGFIDTSENPFLRNVSFPTTTRTFGNTVSDQAFQMDDCDFGSFSVTGLSFKPLSGITMDTNSILGATIYLQNNNMVSAEVDEILGDFVDIVNVNSAGWSGTTLNIAGNNQAPTVTGMGYMGTLTGSPNNWSVTIS